MKISARVSNSEGSHNITVTTNNSSRSLTIPPKPSGFGSSANGGELLFLALATCYCNDVYREAARRGIEVKRVEITVEGESGAEGEPARNVTYRATVEALAGDDAIRDLTRHTDRIAEIQKSLRAGSPVRLAGITAIPV